MKSSKIYEVWEGCSLLYTGSNFLVADGFYLEARERDQVDVGLVEIKVRTGVLGVMRTSKEICNHVCIDPPDYYEPGYGIR
jgi:hypothetical protein